MNPSRQGRFSAARLPLILSAALLSALLLCLGVAGPAFAADYSPQERKTYFDSGKYDQDLDYVAKRAKQFIIKRTAKTLPVVRACKKAGFRIGKKDPGPASGVDYRVPVTVPKANQPIAPIVEAPNPGPGATVSSHSADSASTSKRKKVKRVTKKRCAKTQKLAIAMDMDETSMSSFRYGSPQPNYDFYSMYRNMVLGSQTAIKPMLDLYKLARKRGVEGFVITARYDPLQSDPLIGALTGGQDLCAPSLAAFGACGIDMDSFDFRKVTMANLVDEGYTGLKGLYMRPANSSAANGTGKDVVKNSQRAEITKRRGYKIIAMFGDQNSDLRTGFYERGFKYQSTVTPDQD